MAQSHMMEHGSVPRDGAWLSVLDAAWLSVLDAAWLSDRHGSVTGMLSDRHGSVTDMAQ